MKVAVVTGASQRIGAAIARQAHSGGYNVLIHYRNSGKAALALAEQLNHQRADSAACVQADFSEPGSCSELITECAERWGQLDLLVNNASEFFPTPIGTISSAQITSVFAANVYAPLLLAQAARPYLQSSNGSVVNIVDVYASVVHRDHPVYCASKAALAMLTKSLAVDLAPAIRVNGIAPGAILWPDGESAITDNQKAAAIENIPLSKTGDASQIASAVMYLASDAAAFMTGHIMTIDGGRTL